MQLLQHTLDNGFEILVEQSSEAHSIALGFFVQTGSRDETDEIAGVSHFLEHMAFKGTACRTADDVNREFDEMGAHYNAFTSEENTVYYAAVLPECQQRCAELLADIMRPSLREDDFDMEKQVIVEEIQMYEDQPPFGADDKCKAAHFGSHPLARSVLGTVTSVEGLTAAQMRRYFQQRYEPANMVLAGAGRIDFDALVQQAKRSCGDWPTAPTERTVARTHAPGSFTCLRRAAASQQYVLQMMDGPAATDEDRFAAKLLATIVGDDSGSRLYWELVDSGRAEHASMGHYEYQGAGVYMVYLSCDPNQAEDNMTRLLAVYQNVQGDGIKPDELAQAKTKLKARLVLSSERPRNRLFTVGGNWVSRRQYRSLQDDLEAVERVTIDAVHEVLAKYPLLNSTTLTIGPLAELAEPR